MKNSILFYSILFYFAMNSNDLFGQFCPNGISQICGPCTVYMYCDPVPDECKVYVICSQGSSNILIDGKSQKKDVEQLDNGEIIEIYDLRRPNGAGYIGTFDLVTSAGTCLDIFFNCN